MEAIIASLLYSKAINASPLPPVKDVSGIDSGKDGWADAVSGISPLILLIGERNTKQIIRETRGLAQILSFAFAPLGLISVLTSVIRLCGSHKLRAYLGYEQEARTHAALELTRANCDGIHANLVGGYLVRSTAVKPASQALAVTMLQGNSALAIDDCIAQVRNFREFQEDKLIREHLGGMGGGQWVLRILGPVPDDGEAAAEIRSVIARCIGAEPSAHNRFPHIGDAERSAESIDNELSLIQRDTAATAVGEEDIEIKVKLDRSSSVSKRPQRIQEFEKTGGAEFTITSVPSFPQQGENTSQNSPSSPGPMKVTFLGTFEGVSELTGIPGPSITRSIIMAVLSFATMVAAQVLCFWEEGLTAGCLMVVVGYVGISLGVISSAWLIYTSCHRVEVKVQKRKDSCEWSQGLLLAVKNTDSMETTGSCVWRAKGEVGYFEAVWPKMSHRARYLWVWATTVFLIVSFICHYLGLRTTTWWLSVAELAICLIAAFVRSTLKAGQRRYNEDEDVRLDKRCYSTGILDMQRASTSEERSQTLQDTRIYSFQRSECPHPLSGEFIAWRAAKICAEKPDLAASILKATGMHVSVQQSSPTSPLSLVVTFNGGVITEQGLAFPNRRMCLAFTCPETDIAAPTPLLARGIMRQPKWFLELKDIKESLGFAGGTYITTMDSLLTWWIIAEDRNEMGDQHKNLHGSFILINTAFFIALMQCRSGGINLEDTIEKAHELSPDEDERHALDLLQFLSENLGDVDVDSGDNLDHSGKS